MDREIAESARMAVVLVVVSAILFIGVLAFMLARRHGGEYFDAVSEQHRRISVIGLATLNTSESQDMPTASLYTILAREWRSVASVTITDYAGNTITTGTPGSGQWELTPGLVNSSSASVTKASGPEHVLYAKAPNTRSDRIEGRVYVTVMQDPVTFAYHVIAKRLQ